MILVDMMIETMNIPRMTLLGVLVGVLSACAQPPTTPVASSDLQGIKADVVFYGMESYLTSQGIRQGRVQADTAYMFNDSSAIEVRGMHVVFYDDEGREKATVTSNRGELDRKSDRMIARGNVVLVVAADGRKIESAELHYDPDLNRIWSDSATVMHNGSQVTRGTAFQSDLEFKNVRIENPRGAVGGDIFD